MTFIYPFGQLADKNTDSGTEVFPFGGLADPSTQSQLCYNALFGKGSYDGPDSALEGWWQLQDDAASTVVVDSSGKGRNGTLINAASTGTISLPGPSPWQGKSLAFAAASEQFITVPDQIGLDIVGNLSLLARVRPASLPGSFGRGIVGKYQVGGNYSYLLRTVNGSNGTRSVIDSDGLNGGAILNDSATALTLNDWQSVAAVYRPSTSLKNYLNGTLDGTNTTSIPAALHSGTAPLWIGLQNYADIAYAWDGRLADVSVWSRALSDTEIAEWDSGPEPYHQTDPTITGTIQRGQIITLSAGVWNSQNNGAMTYTYHLYSYSNTSGADPILEKVIRSTQTSRQVLLQGNVRAGRFLRLMVTCENDGGLDPAEEVWTGYTTAIVAPSDTLVPTGLIGKWSATLTNSYDTPIGNLHAAAINLTTIVVDTDVGGRRAYSTAGDEGNGLRPDWGLYDYSDLNGLPGWTLSMWLKIPAQIARSQYIFSFEYSGAREYYVLSIPANTWDIQLLGSSVNTFTWTGAYPSDGNWHHVTFKMEGGTTHKIFIDGVQFGATVTDSMAWGADPGTLMFGGDWRNSTAAIEGRLDSIRMYHVAVPDADILALHNAGRSEGEPSYSLDLVTVDRTFNALFGKGKHLHDPELRALSLLQDDADTTEIIDESRYRNTGTLLNAGNTSASSVTGPNSWLSKAIQLDGTNDYIEFPDADQLSPYPQRGEMSLGIWAYSTLTAIKGVVVKSAANQSEYSVGTTNNASIGLSGYYLGGVGAYSAGTSNGDFQSNQWNHAQFVLEHQGTFRRVYINGVDETSSEGSNDLGGNGTAPLGLGGSAAGGESARFQGSLAGFYLFGRKLTFFELADIRNGPEPINISKPNLFGVVTTGSVVSCDTGTWDTQNNGTPTYFYQWFVADDDSGLNEIAIGGATDLNYLIDGAHLNKVLRVRVRASNAGGYDELEDTYSDYTPQITPPPAVGRITGETLLFVPGLYRTYADKEPSGPAGSAMSAQGTATASGISSALSSSDASADGLAAASAVGQAVLAGTADASGTASATGSSLSLFVAIASSSGSSTADAVGSLSGESFGISSGSSTASAESSALVSVAGSSASSASANAVGAAAVSGVADTGGAGSATAVSSSVFAAIASASGSSDASAVGTLTGSSFGWSVGTATAIAESSAVASSAAAASASATADAVGFGPSSAAASSQGTSLASATATYIASSAAASTASSTAAAAGASLSSSPATSSGSSSVSAEASWIFSAAGLASASSAANGVIQAALHAEASAFGFADCGFFGTFIASSVGLSSGLGAVSAVGQTARSAVGLSGALASVIGRSPVTTAGFIYISSAVVQVPESDGYVAIPEADGTVFVSQSSGTVLV